MTICTSENPRLFFLRSAGTNAILLRKEEVSGLGTIDLSTHGAVCHGSRGNRSCHEGHLDDHGLFAVRVRNLKGFPCLISSSHEPSVPPWSIWSGDLAPKESCPDGRARLIHFERFFCRAASSALRSRKSRSRPAACFAATRSSNPMTETGTPSHVTSSRRG